jgi:hypothetical protein
MIPGNLRVLQDDLAVSGLAIGTGMRTETSLAARIGSASETETASVTVIVTGEVDPSHVPAHLLFAQLQLPVRNMKSGSWKKSRRGRRRPRPTWQPKRMPKPRASLSLV